jgi:chaperonin cofactor prefoldin
MDASEDGDSDLNQLYNQLMSRKTVIEKTNKVLQTSTSGKRVLRLEGEQESLAPLNVKTAKELRKVLDELGFANIALIDTMSRTSKLLKQASQNDRIFWMNTFIYQHKQIEEMLDTMTAVLAKSWGDHVVIAELCGVTLASNKKRFSEKQLQQCQERIQGEMKQLRDQVEAEKEQTSNLFSNLNAQCSQCLQVIALVQCGVMGCNTVYCGERCAELDWPRHWHH